MADQMVSNIKSACQKANLMEPDFFTEFGRKVVKLFTKVNPQDITI